MIVLNSHNLSLYIRFANQFSGTSPWVKAIGNDGFCFQTSHFCRDLALNVFYLKQIRLKLYDVQRNHENLKTRSIINVVLHIYIIDITAMTYHASLQEYRRKPKVLAREEILLKYNCFNLVCYRYHFESSIPSCKTTLWVS